ncbi:MAG: hypothetical protein Q9195_005367 [Heterodermia aff. obscurata]
MEVVAYANEFAFLNDDVTDSASKERVGSSINFSIHTDTHRVIKTQVQAKLILELMSIDRERAKSLVKCWEQLVKAGASGSKDREFLTLDDYVPWRIVDSGEPFWFGIITYGMALTISEDDRKLIMPITAPAFANLALTNDFFSWQKE